MHPFRRVYKLQFPRAKKRCKTYRSFAKYLQNIFKKNFVIFNDLYKNLDMPDKQQSRQRKQGLKKWKTIHEDFFLKSFFGNSDSD